jgi:dipeptidyl aminopeptidase/acylaminoacyl peptidase
MLPAMRSALYSFVLVVVGCSGSPQQQELPGEPPPGLEKPSTASTLPATTTAQPPAKVVDAKPDEAKGDAREAEFTKLATGYVEAFGNSLAIFTPDRKHIVLQSNRDGLPQVYVAEVAKPADEPLRIVNSTERAFAARVTKDGKSVIYRQDTGADENWSIHRVGIDGKNMVELTPGEKLQRDHPYLVDGEPDAMFFTARKQSESRSTLYTASTTKPGAAKAIYTDEMPAYLSDVDPKGATALVTQLPARMENYLLRVDLAAGKAEKLWPTDAKVSIFHASFSADGEQVYVATDGGGEDNVLLALDAKTGKELARYAVTPKTAQIGSVSVAKKGGLLGVSIVAGEHSEILILDSKLEPTKATLRMPLGQGGFEAFSDDGKRIVARWSTPDTPSDVFSVDPVKGTVEPLREDERESLASLPKIKASIVEIPAFDGGKIPTLVYVTEGEESKPHPTIVRYHGGPSGVSMVRWSPDIAFWLSLGYAFVEPNVRGSSGFGRAYEAGDNGKKRLDAFRDIEASARWVAQQPWADKSKLVVYGGSYGGYTTLIALSHWPELWRAGVDLFGIVNLETFMATTAGFIRQLFLTEFGDPDEDAELLAQISPITDVGKIVDPTFVYAGANDPRVPRSESDLIVKALRERNVPTEYMVADNEGHSLDRKETWVEFSSRCARFLETHLE